MVVGKQTQNSPAVGTEDGLKQGLKNWPKLGQNQLNTNTKRLPPVAKEIGGWKVVLNQQQEIQPPATGTFAKLSTSSGTELRWERLEARTSCQPGMDGNRSGNTQGCRTKLSRTSPHENSSWLPFLPALSRPAGSSKKKQRPAAGMAAGGCLVRLKQEQQLELDCRGYTSGKTPPN
ncbi:hypothetical protein Salat_1633000 [Sesamum alatum]|uniref:Uncharacterized protein n=1 Tax=Sesamum alatum TaxID=300844 RepID=A0AAE1Y713_9LAMI|nr:hypothetical protein Salat_1633000 [Sesamum alatum]